MTNKKPNKKELFFIHKHFLAVLVLFVGFSVYAITSFVSENKIYINELYTSVLDSNGNLVVEDAGRKDNPFSDLPDDHYSAEAVIALYYDGIVEGYPDGTFKPDSKVNRAEFSKMLVEASDLDYTAYDASVLANCFPDVKDLPDHWFAPAVCAAFNAGWVKGYDNGFRPWQNINRAEALKIVLLAFGFEIPDNSTVLEMPYFDVASDAWYVGVAVAAKSGGLVSSSDFLYPLKEATRGEIAQMIYNAMRKK